MKKVALVVFDYTAPEGIGKEYGYFYDTDKLDLQLGDLAVVEVSYTFKIVRVERLVDINLENSSIVNKAKKWLVDKVDLTDHIARKQKQQRLKSIKTQLEEKKKELEEIALFEMVAKADQEAAKLLEEMKQLTLEA